MARLCACAALLLVGCAHGAVGGGGSSTARSPAIAVPGAKKTGAEAVAPAVSAPAATGTWEWVFRSGDEQGNTRLEQEEWHLIQRGAALEGYYDRAVSLFSTDDRLFQCNRKLGFTRFTRVKIAGTVDGDQIHLDEVAYDAKPGPCDDGARSLVSYSGVLGGTVLRLTWGDNAGQTLYRRVGDEGNHLARSIGQEALNGIDPDGHASIGGAGGPHGVTRGPTDDSSQGGPQASVPVAGSWVWDMKSIDAEGDERIEHEVWHLDENDDGIFGSYDRTVDHLRSGGVFKCGGGVKRFVSDTHYTVAGRRSGDTLVLREMDYQFKPSACDNNARRLDAYQGTLTATGNELILYWGSGSQVLRRLPGK